MTDLPRISIVTPSYNQGAFLEKTILSVLNEDYPNLQFSIVDGASNDESVEIVRRYEKHLDFWVSEKDRGQSHAINKGLARADGELLGWLNSDDTLEPGALATVAEAYRANPDAGAFVGHGDKINKRGKVEYYKKPGDLSFEGICRWLGGNDFMQPSCFFTREAWEAAGPLDENVHIALDVDLWLRMAKKVRFVPIDALLSHSLIHEDAKTTAFWNRMVVDCALVIIRHGGGEYARPHLDALADRLSEFEKKEDRRLWNRVDRLYRDWFGPIKKPSADKPS